MDHIRWWTGSAAAAPRILGLCERWCADGRSSGAGLGLAIAQQIAHTHGAVLRLEDNVQLEDITQSENSAQPENGARLEDSVRLGAVFSLTLPRSPFQPSSNPRALR